MVKIIIMSILLCITDRLNELVKNQKVASLSTNNNSIPFCSLVPFILDESGYPAILISDLAQHTENIKKDNKCSLMVHIEDKDNPFNSERATFMGKAIKVNGEELEKLKRSFITKHPKCKEFIEFNDFNIYKIEMDKIHYIGGFGDINWINKDEYLKNFKK